MNHRARNRRASRAAYQNLEVRAAGATLEVSLTLPNSPREKNSSVGCQFYDPAAGLFIEEGPWTPAAPKVALAIPFPPAPGSYELRIAEVGPEGWAHARGRPFLRILAEVNDGGKVRVLSEEITTLRAIRWWSFWTELPKLFARPLRAIAQNHRLIRSMARRDILARYRGSFGDVFWTVLNPLLLMSTYFFVFGIVLQTRFGPDQSRTGFALYFLAGMLPWLAFSEPVGRAASVILEYRNFVKKLVFPLDTLPVNQVVSGLVTEFFGAGVFVCGLLIIRHAIPASVLWLPALLVPQLLFTLGVCWFLAALGVYMRDLGQIMALVLTLWFFITPICYPESTNLSPLVTATMRQNPLYILVRGYRDVFLEGHAPELMPLAKLWVIALAAFFLGHVWFYRLRKSFADVI